jgi:hypothetical protein
VTTGASGGVPWIPGTPVVRSDRTATAHRSAIRREPARGGVQAHGFVGRSLGSSGPDGVVARAEISAPHPSDLTTNLWVGIHRSAPGQPQICGSGGTDLSRASRRSVATCPKIWGRSPQICRPRGTDLSARGTDLSPRGTDLSHATHRSRGSADRSRGGRSQICGQQPEICGRPAADLCHAAQDLRLFGPRGGAQLAVAEVSLRWGEPARAATAARVGEAWA